MFDSEKVFSRNITNLINHLEYEKLRGDFLKNIVRRYNCESAIRDEIVEYLRDVERVSLINAKQFTYKNSIISLYGYLESFLENIVREFIQNLNQVEISFSSLPEEIQQFHLELSINLLKKVQRTKANSKSQKNSKIKSVLQNMHTCAQEVNDYQLNEEAFSLHTANFRYDSINALFCKIGIHGVSEASLREEKLRDAIANKHTIDSNFERKVFELLLASDLDDLAQRRNEISHGSFDGELESIDLVISRALCLREFGVSVSKILNDHFHKFIFLSPSKIFLGTPTKVFNGISVFGFSANPANSSDEAISINVGDMVFAHNNSSNRLNRKLGRIGISPA